MGIRIEERRENKQRKPLKDICLGEGGEVDIEVVRKSVDAFHGKMKIPKEMADEIIHRCWKNQRREFGASQESKHERRKGQNAY